MSGCKWANEKHRVWYWDKRGDDILPIPSSATLDNHKDAAEYVRKVLDNGWCIWAKAFRADSSAYECIHERDPHEVYAGLLGEIQADAD